MRGNPIEDHTDTNDMAGIDKVAKIVGRAETAGHTEIARGLVAPGFVQRMLADRHQLDVVEPHLLHVGHEIVRQLAEIIETPVPVPLPGSGMNLIHAQRLMQPVAAGALFLPGSIAPLISIQLDYPACRSGSHLKTQAIRIRLGEHFARIAIAYFELVVLAQTDVRHEDLPHAGTAQRAHRIDAAIPAVEIAHHADALGVRRPHRKAHTPHPVALHVMRAEHAVSLLQTAFGKKIEIVITDAAAERIRVMNFDDMAEKI